MTESESDRLKALLLCSAIMETAAKIQRDLAKAQEAIRGFSQDIEQLSKRANV